jgi:hypothetical protein
LFIQTGPKYKNKYHGHSQSNHNATQESPSSYDHKKLTAANYMQKNRKKNKLDELQANQ